ALSGRVVERKPDAGDGVPDVEEAARLAALAVDRERLSYRRLDAETVEHGAPDGVVVEPGGQPRMLGDLVCLAAVDHALVQVGGAQPPDPADELDVVAVVELGQVVEAPRLHRIGKTCLAPVVGDVDEALFEVDTRR